MDLQLPEAIRTSWPSLAAVPWVWSGYLLALAFERRRAGSACLAVSQLWLVVVGIVDREWALPALIVPVTLTALAIGWWRAGRPDPKVVRLEQRIAELEQRAAA